MAWISFGALPCRGRKKTLMKARVSMLLKSRVSELVSFLVVLRTYQHLGWDINLWILYYSLHQISYIVSSIHGLFLLTLWHLTNTYKGRTAPLTSKRCILYIYSTNICTEYFKHGINSPVFSSSKCSLFHNSNVLGFCSIHLLYTGCAKIKKIIPAPKGL